MFEVTALYYDKYGRVVQTRSTNHLGGYDIAYNALDFLGKPTKTLKTHNIAGQASVVELYTYDYDKAQRPTTTTYSLNGGGAVTLAVNTYDDLGRLKTKTLGGVDATAYSYNVRSWTTDIIGSKFSENLYYNANAVGLPNFTSSYNGNIAGMQWGVANDQLGYNRAYTFGYDGLNRLTDANYCGFNGSVVGGTSGRYDEHFGFDKMGNFNTLLRIENGSMINNLSFAYAGNQLKKVDQIYGTPYIPYGSEAFNDKQKIDTEYDYDKNGSTKWDVNTGISLIQYNLLNLPDQIQFTEGHKNIYTYDASGKKLETVNYTVHNIVNVPINTISTLPANPSDYTKLTTDYVGNMIYENGSLKQILLPEGYWQNGVFYYYLKDHLGDTRLVINSSGTIIEKSHYYPSGMRFADTSTSNSSALPFRYNGKELEAMNGLNQYDYGARRRGAGLPIWTAVDPLAEKHYDISPYVYCAGNPVNLIDPDGMDWYRNDKSGATFWQEGNANSVSYNDQTYRNIGETYSSYKDGMRIDYNQNEVTKASDVSPRFNVEGGQYIPKTFVTDDGTEVKVTFNYKSSTGGNGDKALSKDAVSLLITSVNDANNSDANITSVDVSTTTTGQHSSASAHYVSNGGRALDIDIVNGIPVRNSNSHDQVDAIQNAMKTNPNLRENYGPNIQEKAGKKFPISGHNNHIHASTRRR